MKNFYKLITWSYTRFRRSTDKYFGSFLANHAGWFDERFLDNYCVQCGSCGEDGCCKTQNCTGGLFCAGYYGPVRKGPVEELVRLKRSSEDFSEVLYKNQQKMIEAGIDAALAEVRRQGGPDYLLLEARNDGLAAARDVNLGEE